VEECGTLRQVTDDSTIRRMLFAWWITKVTGTHSEYVTLISFPLQQWLHERVSMLRYTYIACLIKNIRMYYLQRGLFLFFVILTWRMAELATVLRSLEKCNPSPGIEV